MRRFTLCVAATLLAACSSGSTGPPNPDAVGTATVVRVVDGDTIVVDFDVAGGDDERVRLIGVDTPESVAPNRPVECYGAEASAFTATLLPVGTRVQVERDVEARDDYGRLLGYVRRSVDGLFVNLELVRRGYANPLTIPPNVAFADEFIAAARSAREERVGLWTACTG